MGLLPLFGFGEEEDEQNPNSVEECSGHHYGEFKPRNEFKISVEIFYWDVENGEPIGFVNYPRTPVGVTGNKFLVISRQYKARCEHSGCRNSRKKFEKEYILPYEEETLEYLSLSEEEIREDFEPEELP